METNLRTLGANEAKVVLSLREQAQSVVQTKDVIALLGSEPKARKVIYNLVRKGWLSRLVGGRYLFLPPEHGPENLGENNILALASAVVEPSYIGWWSAASFHGFTTQRPMSVTVAVLRQVQPRIIEDHEIRFVKVAPRKFFGFESASLYDRTIAISSKTKTLIDCLDRPDLCGGPAELARIVYGASRDVDPRIAVDTARQMKSSALLQRFGYLMDLVGWQVSNELRTQLRKTIPKTTRSLLGNKARSPHDVGYVAEWGLFVHASNQDLLADVPRSPLKHHVCC